MSYSHRHPGKILHGRAIVAVAAVIILVADWLIFRQAIRTPFPFSGLPVAVVISVIWLIAGAVAMGMRFAWGRAMVLAILYTGAIGFFVIAIITISDADGFLAVRLKSLFGTTFIYLVVSLVLTHSKHVRRLTSRAWE
jgi:hypothetical protein